MRLRRASHIRLGGCHLDNEDVESVVSRWRIAGWSQFKEGFAYLDDANSLGNITQLACGSRYHCEYAAEVVVKGSNQVTFMLYGAT
jgi:hypothetical protein